MNEKKRKLKGNNNKTNKSIKNKKTKNQKPKKEESTKILKVKWFEKKILFVIFILVLISLMTFSYSIYSYRKTGLNHKLILGNIYMNYQEKNALTINDAMPGDDYSDYFEFSINGKNTYKEKDIWYDVTMTRGKVLENRTEENRIPDEYLIFKLTSVVDDVETVLFVDESYDDITNKIIHIGKIPKNTTEEINLVYRLYVKIDNDLEIGNLSSSVFTVEEWALAFANIEVNVTGDFTSRRLNKTGAEKIIDLYGNNTNLVAVNTNGTLYDGSGTIREYRYSGSTANNYVIFNDDGDNQRESNEMWRIVGVFKNAGNEWNIKLMRNEVLSSSELPDYYTINGIEYMIYYDEPTAYFNSENTTNLNSWDTAGLQYFLNTVKDEKDVLGYYSTFNEEAKSLIDENYAYYLGNFVYANVGGDTAVSAYKSERGSTICPSNLHYSSQEANCNIWYNNKDVWYGAVALLYPSDYGYSANSTYWENTNLYNYSSTNIRSSSWMQQTANHEIYEWLLSPSSLSKQNNMFWNINGTVYSCDSDFDNAVRPVINLIDTAGIDINHAGNKSDPYIITLS